MKKIHYKLVYSITAIFFACNSQKSVDPTGRTPIPVGSERPIDSDTLSTDNDTSETLPDTLMKDSL